MYGNALSMAISWKSLLALPISICAKALSPCFSSPLSFLLLTNWKYYVIKISPATVGNWYTGCSYRRQLLLVAWAEVMAPGDDQLQKWLLPPCASINLAVLNMRTLCRTRRQSAPSTERAMITVTSGAATSPPTMLTLSSSIAVVVTRSVSSIRNWLTVFPPRF